MVGVAWAVLAIAVAVAMLVRWRRANAARERAWQATVEQRRVLEGPPLQRAPIALPFGQEIEGEFEVPPRAIVFPRANRDLAGRMLGFRSRWAPARDVVAIQLDARYQSEAVIFDSDRNVLWAPDGACDLAFRRDGSEVVEVGSVHRERPELRRMGSIRLESPLQSELQWYLRRSAWPSREVLAEVAIAFPMGWAREVWLSPDERQACVVFVDQCEGGFLVIELADDAARAHEPLFDRSTSLLGVPEWSPDFSHVAVCATSWGEWWLPPYREPIRGEDHAAYRAELEAHRARGASGGPATAGRVWVQDLGTDGVVEHELVVELPHGWGSDLAEAVRPEIGPLRFVDSCTIEVSLPDGSTRTLPLAART